MPVAGRNLTQAEWAELFPEQAYRVTCPDSRPGSERPRYLTAA